MVIPLIRGRVHMTVAGIINDGGFEHAKAIASDISDAHEDFNFTIVPLVHTDWEMYRTRKAKDIGGKAYNHKKSPLVYYEYLDQVWYLGDNLTLADWAKEKYVYVNHTNMTLFQKKANIAWDTYLSNPKRSFVHLDCSVEGEKIGRVSIELFNDRCPKTCRNFMALCKGYDKNGITMGYKDTPFHRVVKDGWIQGGDLLDGSGQNGESIYGQTFEDECFDIKHDIPGIVGMANDGPHSNSSQFYITTQPLPFLDYEKVGFGRVIAGMRVVRLIEKFECSNQRPVKEVWIRACGQLLPRKLRAPKKKREYTEDQMAARIQASFRGHKHRAGLMEQLANMEEEEGHTYTWGDGVFSQLGHREVKRYFAEPTILKPFANKKVKQMSCGWMHTGLILDNGKLFMWGKGNKGQLAQGNDLNYPHPVIVEHFANTKIHSVACGGQHTLCVTKKGNLFSWGQNEDGELGLGHIDEEITEAQMLPRQIEYFGTSYVGKIAAGGRCSAVIFEDSVFTWGRNICGQLGHGEPLATVCSPKEVAALAKKGVTDVSLSMAGYHTMVLIEAGSVFAWGLATDGQIGIGEMVTAKEIPTVRVEPRRYGGEDVFSVSPIEIAVIDPATDEPIAMQSVSCGQHFSALLSRSGELYMVGRGCDGVLGYLPPENGDSTADVMSTARDTTSRHDETQSQTATSTTQSTAQSGTTATTATTAPIKEKPAPPQETPRSVASNKDSEAVEEVKRPVILPGNEYQPRKVEMLENVLHVSTGGDFVGALVEGGDMFTWGNSAHFQLGHNNHEPSPLPERLNMLSYRSVEALYCGQTYMAAVSGIKICDFDALLAEKMAPVISEFRRELIEKLFGALDVDGSGVISLKEIYPMATKLQPGVTEEKVIEGLMYIDRSGDMMIQFPEFLIWFSSFTAEADDEEFENGINYLLSCDLTEIEGEAAGEGAEGDAAEGADAPPPAE